MPVQTDEQRKAAFAGAGLNADQQAGVNAGKGYTRATASPTTSTAPISRTIDDPLNTAADAAQNYLNTSEFTPPKTAAQIAEEKRQASQGLIDSINKQYDDQVAASQKAGAERVGQTDAISVLAGLSGSTDAAHNRQVTTAANQKEIDAINNQRATALQQIYTKISSDADTEAKQQLADATKNAQDVIARRTAAQSQAVDSLKQMAAGGLVDFDAFKNSPQNAKVYQYALNSVGGSEDALRALFAINRPQDQVVGTPTRIGDNYMQAYKNPITGKVSFETIPLPAGLGSNYTNFQKLGDNLVAIPDNWDGDVSKLRTIAGPPDVMKQLQIQGLQLDNAKKAADLKSGGAPSGYNGEFAATIDLAANQGGTNAQRGQIKTTLQNFVANQDYPSAYAAISSATGAGLKGAAATTFQQQQNSLGVLDSLQQAIQAYSDAGGSTNIFKGSEDQIQTKIGKLMTDPKYASLAVQLNAAFQNYRLQMTGAAFGNKESAEYAAILPAPGNTLDLNLAKLAGAKAYLNSSVESSIKSVVGQGGVNIKTLAEKGAAASASARTSRVLVKDGQQFDASDLTDAEYQEALSAGYTAQ